MKNLSSGMSQQNSFFQSQFVPAEKPYAVYAFVWEGTNTSIAQLIGTMVTGQIDKDGEVCYKTNAVYRMPRKDMLDFEHCFIDNHTGEICFDSTNLLGFVGDTVGIEAISIVYLIDQKYGDNSIKLKSIVQMIEKAGLKIDKNVKQIGIQKGQTYQEQNPSTGKMEYCLDIHGQIAIFTNLMQKKSHIIKDVAEKFREWEELGIKDFTIQMAHEDQQACYTELLDMASFYNSHSKEPENVPSLLYTLIQAREELNKNECSYDKLATSMRHIYWTDYYKKHVDDEIQKAIQDHLITRNGDIIQFCNDIERMMSWEPVCR